MFVTSEMLKTIARPFETLSSLLSTAPQPGMRATASDAPGSMLYEVGGKWGGDLGSVSQATLDSLTAGSPPLARLPQRRVAGGHPGDPKG